MGNFASLETAAKVRDLVAGIATRQIGVQVQRPVVGRVVHVDILNMRAMVWFQGDEQPIPVHIIPGRIPGSWARRAGISGAPNTSTEGYGSIAVCQRFNGQLYVTDTITGGEFAYNLQALNFDNIELLPWDGTGDIVGQPAHSRLSLRVRAGDQITGIPTGSAVVFGPFRGVPIPTSGVVQMWIADANNAKRYKFNFMSVMLGDEDPELADLDSWYRVLPEAEDFNAEVAGDDWDLEVSFRKTSDTVELDGVEYVAMYFRMINRSPGPYIINHKVSVDSNVLTSAQSPKGHFVAEYVAQPSFEVGYLGFHGQGGLWSDLSKRLAMDRFGRVTASGQLGKADTGQAWTPATGSFCDGTGMVQPISRTSVGATERIVTMDPNPEEGDTDAIEMHAVVSVGNDISNGQCEINAIWRYQDANNYYAAGLYLQANNNVDIIIFKRVSGSFTTLYTASTGVTWTPGQRWGLRILHETTTILLRAWRFDEELNNHIGVGNLAAHIVTDTSITAPGLMGIRFRLQNTASGTQSVNFKLHEFKAGSILRTGFPTQREPAHAQWRNPRLRTADILQKTSNFTKLPRYAGGRFTWQPAGQGTGFILIGGGGRHRDSIETGRTYVQMPTSGQIPIIPSGGHAVVNSSGIPLAPGQSLWLGIPPSMEYESAHKHLFIVDGPDYAQQMGVPEYAILIASIPFAENQFPVLGLDHSKIQMILDLVYPVGSIYLSINNVNPQTYLGGTWVAIADRFLVGAGNAYTANTTGGSTGVQLGAQHMPPHSHDVPDVIFPSGGSGGSIGYVESWPGGSGSRSVRTDNQGGGQPFTVTPPYYAVYMWRRTS